MTPQPVTGDGFTYATRVHVDGSARSVTFVRAHELTIRLFDEDVAEPGALPGTVFTPEPGGGESDHLTLTTAP